MTLPWEEPATCPVFDCLFDIFAKIPLVEKSGSPVLVREGAAASRRRTDCSLDELRVELVSVFSFNLLLASKGWKMQEQTGNGKALVH